MSIITLATDYGTADGYTAAVKGVLKAMAPGCEIIDISHDLTTILKTSLVVCRYSLFYPPGVVHLVVVDPTVGSNRRAIMGRANGQYFVGPDNGIFTHIIQSDKLSQWYSIDISKLKLEREISSTFHGRDVFAPAAALLSKGKQPDELGNQIGDPAILELSVPSIKQNLTIGEVIDIDKFGNLITNISASAMTKIATVSVNGENIPLRRTFSDIAPRFPLAYMGSLGFLEIAVNQGRADEYFKAGVGEKVEVISDLPCL